MITHTPDILPTQSAIKPVIFPDFPDPTILRVDDATYIAFGTQSSGPRWGNLQRTMTFNGGLSWMPIDKGLTTESGWETWAPSTVKVNQKVRVQHLHGLHWILYSEHNTNGNHCRIKAAYASSPFARFTPLERPIIRGHGIHHIDPCLTYDPIHTDQFWLTEGSGWYPGAGIRQWKFDPETMTVIGPPIQLTENTPDDPTDCLHEAAEIDVVPNSPYPFQLHISRANYQTNYVSEVRVAEKISGPYHAPPHRSQNLVLSDGPTWKCLGQIDIFDSKKGSFACHGGQWQDNETHQIRNRPMFLGTFTRDQYGIPNPVIAG